MKIQYLTGDATDPKEVQGTKLIIHVCNIHKAWGAGFVLALSKKWQQPEEFYRNSPSLNYGDIHLVQVEPDTYVVNMMAQTLGWQDGIPLSYNALRRCLSNVEIIAKAMRASVVGPRFGAGLAGGDWGVIENIIEEELLSYQIPVYIYDLPQGAE